ncbi:MAG: SDR family oxidoreductase [Gammaproteobacteria bacterium]|nr:SDR family oxidoreductase [Gammaproteobacteria bacterium]
MDVGAKTVVVTGGGNGIGRAIALAMAAAGGRVAVVDVNPDAAHGVAEEIRALGGECSALSCDVSSVEAINAMLDTVLEQFGSLDVIVNNAGVSVSAYIMDLTEADWDRMHAVNAKGVFFCLQGAARRMIDQGGGVIINIASIAGRGFKDTSNAAYAASKGAVISLTKTAAQQLGRHNINVNAICPGITRTPLLERLLERRANSESISVTDAEARMSAQVPIRRINEPEDIAALAVFLASPAARNVTGQAWNVDGGIITS